MEVYAGPESTHSWYGCTRWFGLILQRNQTQRSSIRRNFIHTPLIWSTTYERDKVFDINHWTRSMKQTPTRASSCGRCAHIAQQCGRGRVSVTECMTAYQNRRTTRTPLASITARLGLSRVGAVVHMTAERGSQFRTKIFQPSAPDGRHKPSLHIPNWIWLRSFLRFFFFFWFWTTVFNWVSQSTGRIRTKQKTNSINRSIQINTGRLEQGQEPQGQKPML